MIEQVSFKLREIIFLEDDKAGPTFHAVHLMFFIKIYD